MVYIVKFGHCPPLWLFIVMLVYCFRSTIKLLLSGFMFIELASILDQINFKSQYLILLQDSKTAYFLLRTSTSPLQHASLRGLARWAVPKDD